MPIARELRAMGHEAAFAFRDPTQLRLPLSAGFEVFAAPRLRTPRERVAAPLNHSDMLLGFGYADREGLVGALRGWRALIDLLRPRALVCDYAPTAIIAARSAGLPVVAIGSGFGMPPSSDPMPDLRPWDPASAEELHERDARVLGAIREAAPQSGIRHVADAFHGDLDLLATFGEIDPYGPRELDYIGPLAEDDAGAPAAFRTDAGPRAVAYLKRDDPRTPVILAALDRVAVETIAAVPGASPAMGAGLARVRVHPAAVRLAGLLEGAQLAVSHAGAGFSARAAAAGVAHAMLPQHVEQSMVARRVEAVGAGRVLPHDTPLAAIAPWVAEVLRDASLTQAARAIAKRHAGFSFAGAAREAAIRIAKAAG